jgi:hypothetical protein
VRTAIAVMLLIACKSAPPTPINNQIAEPATAPIETRPSKNLKLRFVVTTAPAPRGGVMGELHGIAMDEHGEPMIGCTVVATSPALIGEQVALTDDQGRWQISNLPPGLYTTTYYYSNITYSHANIDVRAGHITVERVLDWPEHGENEHNL